MLRLPLRRLAKSPAFTAFSIGTLALGIGVTTAIYSAILSVNRHSVGVTTPDNVVTVRQVANYKTDFSGPELAEIRTQQSVFSDVSAFAWSASSLSARGRAELVRGEAVSGDYFEMLGVRPALGRLLHSGDDRSDAAPVVVLSDEVWRQRFDADPAIVGSTVRLGGRPFDVVGIAPKGFSGVHDFGASSLSFWAPMSTAPAIRGRGFGIDLTSRDARALTIIARLMPGVTPDTAASRLQPLVQQMDLVSPLDRSPNHQQRRPVVVSAFAPPSTSGDTGDMTMVALMLPVLVLLVACTNVANLALSRNASRRHEFAVRRALGASRLRVISEQLIEGAIVSIAGGLGGCLVAAWLLALFASVTAGFSGIRGIPPLSFAPAMDVRVFIAAGGFALLAFLIASLSPALQLTRTGDRTMLASDTGAGVAPRWRGRANLIALQVWVSVGLFLLTALGVRMILQEHNEVASAASAGSVAQVDLAFDVQQRDEATARRIADQIVTELRAQPGIEGVGLRARSQGFSMTLTTPDRPLVPKLNEGQSENIELMTPETFRLMDVTMRAGRRFDERDDAGQAPVIIVNESLGRALFGRADVVGETVLGRLLDLPTLTYVTKTYRIAGVSADVLDRRGKVDGVVYAPFTQHYFGEMSVLARGRRGDVDEAVTMARTAVRNADPDVAISFAGRANPERWVQAAIARLVTIGAGAIAALALILSMTGLYGVLSHVVQRRTREIGLRMALGADRGRIIKLILGNGFRPVIEGLVLGSISALIIRALVQPFFTNLIADFDPLLVALAAGPLFVAAGLACYLPARRASKVEPNVALREA